MKPNELPDLLVKNPKVPTLSPVAAKVLALAASERTSAKQIADIITSDAGLSSKILAIANSSFYGRPAQTTRITDAVSVLGMRAVRNAVLGVSVFDLMDTRGAGPSFALTMWERSLNISALSRMLGQRVDLDPEEAFVLGLLSDVGILAVIHLFPVEYSVCAPRPGMAIDSILERERATFGIDHQEAGKIMAERWNLPPAFCEAIAKHHAPLPDERPESIELAGVLNIAAQLVHCLHDSRQVSTLAQVRTQASTLLGIERKDLDSMLVVLPERVGEIVSQFDLKIEAPMSYVEAVLVANERLAEMLQKYEEVNHQLQEANRELKRLASKDGLTGLSNRREFEEEFGKECARSARYGNTLVLAMGDVDDFKSCNDTHGHLAGDEVLRAVGSIMDSSLRKNDVKSRFGGDEFAILLTETDVERARGAVDRLRLQLAQKAFRSEKGTFSATISFGIAAFDVSTDAADPSLLLQRADAMLYKAKQAGCNRVFCAGDPDGGLVESSPLVIT